MAEIYRTAAFLPLARRPQRATLACHERRDPPLRRLRRARRDGPVGGPRGRSPPPATTSPRASSRSRVRARYAPTTALVIGAARRAVRAARPRCSSPAAAGSTGRRTARGRRLSAARSPPRSRSATPPDRPSRRSAPARCCSPRPGSSTAAARRRTRSARRPARARHDRGRRGPRRRRRRHPHRRRAGVRDRPRAALLERIGGPGLAEAAARELQYEWSSDRSGLQPVGERA